MYLVARSAFLLLLHFLKVSDGFCPRACQCNEEALSGNTLQEKMTNILEEESSSRLFFEVLILTKFGFSVLCQQPVGSSAHHSEPRDTKTSAPEQQHQSGGCCAGLLRTTQICRPD